MDRLVVQREIDDDLVVKKGSLPDLDPAIGQVWKDLSNYYKIAPLLAQIPTPDGIHPLGHIDVVSSAVEGVQESWSWSSRMTPTAAVYDSLDPTLRTTTLGLVRSLMEANGQMPYIRRQPWFQPRGGWQLAIDVNYYPSRTLDHGSELGFHKDSDGSIIFVNLIFNNKAPIPATEYLIDAEQPGADRAPRQNSLLPEEHRGELDRTRESLKARGEDQKDISGGLAPPWAYMSWADDLLWHSTPQLAPRALTDEGAARAVYDVMGKFVRDAVAWPKPYRLLIARMLRTGSTLAAQQTEGRKPHNAWNAYGRLGEFGFDAFWKDCGKVDWGKELGKVHKGEALSNDAGVSILEPVPESGKRRRVASLTSQPAIQKAFEDTKSDPRSFLRTWVRITPRLPAKR